jgi:hypothetical protein
MLGLLAATISVIGIHNGIVASVCGIGVFAGGIAISQIFKVKESFTKSVLLILIGASLNIIVSSLPISAIFQQLTLAMISAGIIGDVQREIEKYKNKVN